MKLKLSLFVIAIASMNGQSSLAREIYSGDLQENYNSAQLTQAQCLNPGYYTDPATFKLEDCRACQASINLAKAQLSGYPFLVNHTKTVEAVMSNNTIQRVETIEQRQNSQVIVSSVIDGDGVDSELLKASDANDLYLHAGSCKMIMATACLGKIAPEDKAAGRAEENACGSLEMAALAVREEKKANADRLTILNTKKKVIYVQLDEIHIKKKKRCFDENNREFEGGPNCEQQAQIAKFCVDAKNNPIPGDPATCAKVCAATEGVVGKGGDNVPVCPKVCVDADLNIAAGNPSNCPANTKAVASTSISSLGEASIAVVDEKEDEEYVVESSKSPNEELTAEAPMIAAPAWIPGGIAEQQKSAEEHVPAYGEKGSMGSSPAIGNSGSSGAGNLAGGSKPAANEKDEPHARPLESKENNYQVQLGGGGSNVGSGSTVNMAPMMEGLQSQQGPKAGPTEMQAPPQQRVAEKKLAQLQRAPAEQQQILGNNLFSRVHRKYQELSEKAISSRSALAEAVAQASIKQYP